MKKFSTRLLALVVLALGLQTAFAQGNQDQNFVLQITSASGQTYEYKEGADCSILGTSGWAGSIATDFCAPIVWAYDVTPDSLCCDTITNDYTGKIVVIRRGACEFGRKALWAQYAGAIAVIVVNHYATATDNDCTQINMGAGAVGANVTIPMCFAPRGVGVTLDAIIKEGPAEACFLLPRTYDPTCAYHWATPVSQVDTLGNISMHYVNRTSDVQSNVVLKCDITSPNGSVATLTAPIGDIAPGLDTLVYFDAYMPPAIEGTFHAVFTNNQFSEGRDSLRREFVHTKYTWSQATFTNDPGGIGPANQQFIDAGYRYQVGGLCLTGDTPGAKATYVSFGISNIDSVYVAGGNSGENDILVFVYDGDVDDDGQIDFEATWQDMDAAGQQIAFGTYTMQGTEQDGQIVHASLIDNTTGDAGIALEPNHPYYVSILYDGLLAGYGRCVRLMNSPDEHYLNFPTTPVYIDQMYSGWAGAVVMHRLQLEGFDPAGTGTNTAVLDNSKVNVAPNPASDLVNVNLSLASVNKSVAVRLLDWTGRVVNFEKRQNAQNEQIAFDTKSLPSGVYMLWISTEEGTAVKKVAVCH